MARLSIAGLLLLSHTAHAAPVTYYVSTTGSDGNNGLSPGAPFATFQHVQYAITALKGSNGGVLPGAVTVNISPGTYFEPISITPASGGDTSPVTYVAQTPGSVVVSGGTPLKGWTQSTSDPSIYTVTRPGGALPRAIFAADGSRRSLASTPMMIYTSYNMDASNHVQLVLPAGQLNASAAALADANVYTYHCWTSSLNGISSYDTSNNTLILAGVQYDHYNGASGNRYRIINIADVNTIAPGELFFTSSDNTITYRAMAGEDPNAAGLVLPLAATVLSVAGNATAGSWVQNVAFVNLTFAHTDAQLEWQCLPAGCDGQSASNLANAAVEFSYAQSVSMTGCEVRNTGQYAVWVHAGSSNVTVASTFMHDLGAGGVRIGTNSGGTAPSPDMMVVNVTVTDCEIMGTGQVVEAGAGVLSQGYVSGSSIVHNHIHNLYYTAISVGWTWGYAPTSNYGMNVSFNYLHDVFMGRLSDGGCIYTLGTDRGTVLDHNLCHDVVSYGYGGWGYYTDEGSSWETWSNNIVFNTKSGGLHQHYGENNTWINNVIAFPDIVSCDGAGGCDNAGVRSSQHPPGQDPGSNSSFAFNRNIVLLRNASASLFYTTMPTGFVNMSLDNNVYWNEAAAPDTLQFPPTQAPTTFAAWQGEGKDVHSVVADPQFVNADGYDFTHLQPSSPALALGFVPIDTSNIGPRAEAVWWV